MSPIYWGALIPACLAGAWLIVRRPLRDALEDLGVDRARDQFRLQREGLEARFLSALGRMEPLEKLRWDDARWRDEVVWARDRRTRRLLAMVGVTFDVESFGEYAEHPARHATALFEYRKGRWHAEGKRLDEIRPDEAFIRNQRFEPVVMPPAARLKAPGRSDEPGGGRLSSTIDARYLPPALKKCSGTRPRTAR